MIRRGFQAPDQSPTLKNNTPGAPAGTAAPAGGAFGCRGCANSGRTGLSLTASTAYPTALAALSVLALSLWPGVLPAQDEEILTLPSGLTVSYLDRIDESPTWRYRYVTPVLGGDGVDFNAVAEDMAALCTSHALPQLQHDGQTPERIIVALMSEKLDFGVMSPEVRQFFESYSVEDNLCIWEVF